MYAVSEDVRCKPGSRRKGLLRNGCNNTGGEGGTPYVGGACISGTQGSGAVFFSGCSLRCIFCQNFEIAEGNCAKEISGERLSEIFLELQEQGAANINLVTAAHYVPAVIESLKKARRREWICR